MTNWPRTSPLAQFFFLSWCLFICRVPLKDQQDLPEEASMGMEALLLMYVYYPVFSCLLFDLQVIKPYIIFAYVLKSVFHAFSWSLQQREETQSFAQKLQLKVPSMESLIRSGASRAENLFRSPSKESLVRSSSRESLTPLGENDSPGVPTYDPPSDIESEAEEPSGNLESLPKDQLLQRLLRVERSLGKYRGKYSEVRVTQRVWHV